MPETQRKDRLTRRSGIVTAALGLLLACGSGCTPDRTTTLLEVTYHGQLWLHEPDGTTSRRASLTLEGRKYVKGACRWQPQSLAILWTDERIRIHDLTTGAIQSELPGKFIGLASSNALDQLAVVERPGWDHADSLTLKLLDRALQEKASFDVPITLNAITKQTEVIISWSADDSVVAVSTKWLSEDASDQEEGSCKAILVDLTDMSTTTLSFCNVYFLPEGRIAAARGRGSEGGIDIWRRRDGKYRYEGPISGTRSMMTVALPAGPIVTHDGRQILLIDPLLADWTRVAVREAKPPYWKMGRTSKVSTWSTVLIIEDAPPAPTPSDTGSAPDGSNKPNS